MRLIDRKSFRSAWRFFQEHAGYATTPGRAKCAKMLAEAECAARSLGWSFSWEVDDCPDRSWDDSPEQMEREYFGCVMSTHDGETVSLWGIVEPTEEYRRVVEAELALECAPLADIS